MPSLVPRSRRSPLPRTVRLLGWTSLLNDVASEMIFPLLPQFFRQVLGGSALLFGVMEGLADSTSSLLKLVAGGWSDRWGQRRGFVTLGYALAAWARPCAALVVAPWQMIAVRLTDRLGKGLRAAPRDALLTDATAPEDRGRAFGFHRSMDHLGAAIGPILATAFLWFFPEQLRWLFFMTLLPGVAVTALVWWGLPNQPRDGTAEEPRFDLRWAPLGGDLRRLLVALTIFALGNSSDGFLLLRAGELGVPLVWLPLLWFAFHVLKSAGNFLSGHWVHSLGARGMIFAGWTVYAITYLGFGWARSGFQVAALFALYALFYALTEPAEKTLVAQLAPESQRGLAFGWFHFVTGLAALPASMLLGFLLERFGAEVAFGSGAALAGAAALVLCGVQVPAESKR